MRNALQTSRYVDCCPEQSTRLIDHISKMDADTELAVSDLALARQHCLESHCAAHGLHGASELRKHAVASCVGDPSSMMFDLVIYRVSDSADSGKRPGLVKLHALGIGNHIRRHDGSEAMVWLGLVGHKPLRTARSFIILSESENRGERKHTQKHTHESG